MFRHHHAIPIRPSLLERLLEQGTDASRTELSGRDAGLELLRRAVCRDLETLLNTRNPFLDLPDEFREARQSVITYGLPDLTTFNVVDIHEAHRLRHAIELAIRSFEPRLADVTVSLAPATVTDRAFGLRVDARLIVDPAPLPICFDVVVPPGSVACQVCEVA